MGRKQQTENKEKEEPKELTKDGEEEDTPVVKQLKEIDDRYTALEKEYLREIYKLRASFADKLKSNTQERLAKLRGDGADGEATKALPKFWLTALKNHPMSEMIFEHDEPVLEYLEDITQEFIDSENHRKGMRLTFHFVPNKWFDHKTLSITIIQKDEDLKSLWQNEEAPVTEIKCDPEKIEWKAGQDITVEKVQKKVKGGGAKKAKQKKEKEEPRSSFFRYVFRSVKEDDELPKDLEDMMQEFMPPDMMGGDEEEEPTTEDYLMNVGELVGAINDQIIPYAVRWYTGEAAPDDDSDMEDGDSELDFEEDESEDEDDDDDDDSPPRGKKGGGRGKGAPKKKAGKSPKDSPATGPAADPKKEECKQQ